jgi:hypothetical protein
MILDSIINTFSIDSAKCSWPALAAAGILLPLQFISIQTGSPRTRRYSDSVPPHGLVACKSAKALFIMRICLLCVNVNLKRSTKRVFIQPKTYWIAVRFPQYRSVTLVLSTYRSRGSSVGIVTRPRAGEIVVLCPAEVKACWHIQPAVPWVLRLVLLRR